jgi:hypothetical protein
MLQTNKSFTIRLIKINLRKNKFVWAQQPKGKGKGKAVPLQA